MPKTPGDRTPVTDGFCRLFTYPLVRVSRFFHRAIGRCNGWPFVLALRHAGIDETGRIATLRASLREISRKQSGKGSVHPVGGSEMGKRIKDWRAPWYPACPWV